MAIEHKNYNPDLMAGADNSTTGPTAITSNGNQALAVGANGATNPVLNVDASTASVATGITVKGAAATGGVAITVTSSGTNEPLKIDAKGSGTITLGGTSTGAITLTRATTASSTLTSIGNFVVGSNKLVVTAASGNTAIAGTLEVTGAVTHTSTTLCSDNVTIASGKQIIGAGTGANGIVLKNLKNAAASNLSGTQKDIEIDIGGVPYYFTVYPTKA